MTVTLTPRILELDAEITAAHAKLDDELFAVLAAHLKVEYPGATAVRIYARLSYDGGGTEIDNLQVDSNAIAPLGWAASEDQAVLDLIEPLALRMLPLTSKLVGPCTRHPGESHWYQL